MNKVIKVNFSQEREDVMLLENLHQMIDAVIEEFGSKEAVDELAFHIYRIRKEKLESTKKGVAS